jgi:acyl-CoA thioesterase
MPDFRATLESLQPTGAPGAWVGHATEDWLQGRTVYGGLIAAWAVRALAVLVPPNRTLRSLDVAFVGPIAAGDVPLQARVLRAGKYLTHAVVQVGGDDGGTRIHAVLAADRPSALQVQAPPAAPEKAVEEGFAIPFLPGIVPAFSQHFAYVLTEGGIPFGGGDVPSVGGYFRHQDGAGGMEAMVAMLDAWSPAVLPLADRPVPASTVRWTVQVVGDVPEGDAGWWWYRSDTCTASAGYAVERAQLWAGGRLVALAEQLVAVFDGPAAG